MRNFPLTLVFLLSITSALSQMDLATSLGAAPVGGNTGGALIFSGAGTSRLENGRATIGIDPQIQKLLGKGARIDEVLEISLQMEGESNGIYMAGIEGGKFVVREIGKGTSCAPFSYRVTLKGK